MVLSAQMAVRSVERQDSNAGLLVHGGTGLQQLSVRVELAVRQQENPFPWSDSIMPCWQTFVPEVIIKVFFHLTFKVILVPFPLAVGTDRQSLEETANLTSINQKHVHFLHLLFLI